MLATVVIWAVAVAVFLVLTAALAFAGNVAANWYAERHHPPEWLTQPGILIAAAVLAGIAALVVGAGFEDLSSASETGGSSTTSSTTTFPPTTSPQVGLSSAAPPSATPAPLRVSFLAPAPDQDPVEPGSDVIVRVKVSGLSEGQSLWVVSQSDSGDHYYVVLGEPIATYDGETGRTDSQVGDKKTDHGKGFTYYAVLADSRCSEALTSLGRANEARRFDAWPEVCPRPLSEPTARINFS